MKYRIITFVVSIDGTKTEPAVIGTIGHYNPNLIKTGIIKQHKATHPDAHKVAVIFVEVKQVTEEEYNEAAKNFTALT